MSTNLRYEHFIKQTFGPNLGRIRTYTKPTSYTMTCYIEDRHGELTPQLKEELESWLENNRLATMRYEVKPFSAIVDDNIPARTELPVFIENLALNAQISVAGVKSSLQIAFPYLGSFELLENVPSQGHITIKTATPITDEQEKEITLYSPEFMPPGIVVHVNS
ncbi:hypothetical protein E1B06_15065 [Brevibacillus laterosporus]|uniref:hypothetical protein n=1 Tax=Brevibacillus laterosporus TaxID=1465 RepID=UPI00240672B3|nr:hypothetical protein [Brevibacillus laterosporus]MDF9413004.1 hypothetical protein [Brevibacillus laterosporus]